MPYQTIDVTRPFQVVAGQILALDEGRLEYAARNALRGTANWGAPLDESTTGVRVRVGWPRQGKRRLWLPLDWEVTGIVGPWALRGALDARELSLGETRLAFAAKLAGPDHGEPIRVAEASGRVTQSFLRQVFWILEALTRHELTGPSEPGTSRV